MVYDALPNVIIIGLVIILSLILIPLFIFVPIYVRKEKYTKFVIKHSEALKNLKEINNKYLFYDIKNLDFFYTYDNEDYYNVINPKDILIYEINERIDTIDDYIRMVYSNKNRYESYKNEIHERCTLQKFDTDKVPLNKKFLLKIEKDLLQEYYVYPVTELSSCVTMRLTDLYEQNEFDRKYDEFDEKEILTFLNRIRKKNGKRYLDDNVWNSLCLVERGKVTNELRFELYERDHYICKKCGKTFYYNHGLEIDHIIPISKGGKSTKDNLQCLCHKCNKEKDNEIINYRKR